MVDPIDLLKGQARVLHRAAQAGEVGALARHRRLKELAELGDDALKAAVLRRHSLAVLARELGFSGWSHATGVIRGDVDHDFGTLLYPDGCSAYWNIWLASYAKAAEIRGQTGGYLLAYRRHYFIVDHHYVANLGLDPEDPAWAAMGRDWARPQDLAARTGLYGQLIARRFAEGDAVAA